MRQEHRAGEKMFVGYAGPTVAVVDRETGEECQAQIFVAVLGASSYTFAEATWTQTLADLTGSHICAFDFSGGCPEPDNLRSSVSRAHRYELDINSTFHDLAHHYGVAVLPGAGPAPSRVTVPTTPAGPSHGRWSMSAVRGDPPSGRVEFASGPVASTASRNGYHGYRRIRQECVERAGRGARDLNVDCCLNAFEF